MIPFFRFPRTPHLAWLGRAEPRGDKLLLASEVEGLLSGEVVIEEKVDGANLGFSVDEAGGVRVQNRGSYLDPASAHPQFRALWAWLKYREVQLSEALAPDRMLFGEWCHAVHSLTYLRLPDWFLGFDVYDRALMQFWDSARRNELLEGLGLHAVPRIAKGHFTVRKIEQLLSTPSRVGDGPVEGLVIRREAGGITTGRAKIVRSEFTQAIEGHWSRAPFRWNSLVSEAAQRI